MKRVSWLLTTFSLSLLLLCVSVASPAHAQDSRIQPAISWAIAQADVSSHAWDNWCAAFCFDAYQTGAGATITRYDSAKTAADVSGAAANRDVVPPAGAFVFWDYWGYDDDGNYGNWGHMGLALNDGRIVHAFGSAGVVITGRDVMSDYIGWSAPQTTPPITDFATYNYCFDTQYVVSGDFNADGYADALRMVSNDGGWNTGLWAFMSNGSRFVITNPHNMTGWRWSDCKLTAGDVDGDGADELCAFYNYGVDGIKLWVFDPVGQGFTAKIPWQATSGWDWNKIKSGTADIDGDGCDEVFAFYDYAGWNGWDTGLWLWDIAGSTASNRLVWKETHDGWWDWASTAPVAGDFDGDGADEVGAFYNYGLGANGFFTFRLTGDTAVPTKHWHADFGWDWTRVKSIAADLDSDGEAEIASLYNYDGAYGFAVGLCIMDDPASASHSNIRRWAVAEGWEWERLRLLADDIDGDGKAEVFAFYDYSNEELRLWAWRPDRNNWAGFNPWWKPAGAWSAGTVTSPTGVFSADPLPLPTVTSLTPATGLTSGGTSVAITGTGFTGATAVSFGGTAATSYTVNSSTRITAVSPPHALGTLQVQVTTPAGASTDGSSDDFTYYTTDSLVVPMNAGWSLLAGSTGSDTQGNGLFAYTGGTYESTPAALLQAGRGHWVKYQVAGMAVLTTVSSPVTVPVQSGWNLIGNPTLVPLRLPSGYSAFVYTGDGYQSTTVLAPGEGAWVRASADETVVLVP